MALGKSSPDLEIWEKLVSDHLGWLGYWLGDTRPMGCKHFQLQDGIFIHM